MLYCKGKSSFTCIQTTGQDDQMSVCPNKGKQSVTTPNATSKPRIPPLFLYSQHRQRLPSVCKRQKGSIPYGTIQTPNLHEVWRRHSKEPQVYCRPHEQEQLLPCLQP